MSLFVPIVSAQAAIADLVCLEQMSQIANTWSRELGHRMQLRPELVQECSAHLIPILHRCLKSLYNEKSQEYITLEGFYALLARTSGPAWQDAMSHVEILGLDLPDVMSMLFSLREATVRALEDAGFTQLDQIRVIVYLFDWLLLQSHEHWRREASISDPLLRFSSLDLKMLRSIAESVRSPVDLNPVLQAIVERVRDSGLWPMCAIGIIDPDDQEIRVPAQSGFSDTYPANIKFPADGSATLATIHRQRPLAIADVYEDHEFPVLREAARAAGYRSILLVPILVAGMRGTVAFCSDITHEYQDSEIALANAISQQVMIALENAYQHYQEKQRVDELESLNRLIAEQNSMLQNAVNTHTTLTRLVLDNAGLDRILEAIREILGNPVAIEDELFRLLIFSDDWQYFDQHRRDSIVSGGTTPVVFENQQTARIIDELHRHRRAMLLPVLPSIGMEKRRIVAPIIAGAEILGYVWVLESLRSFHEQQDLITTEQAALIIALEIMKQRATYETEMRLKADFLRDLLSENPIVEMDLLQRARYLGFSFTRPAMLVAVDVDEGTGKVADDIMKAQSRRRQILSRIQDSLSRFDSENLVVSQSGRIMVIVSACVGGNDEQQTTSHVDRLIREVIEHLLPRAHVLIGISDTFKKVAGVRQAWLQANRAIDAARSLGKVDATLRLNDLGVYGLLFRKGDSGELLDYARASLVPLLEYDALHGTELVHTLDVYLIHQSKLAEAARHLYIHVNTLRQRLERVEQILRISLKEPLTILNLQLALRIRDASQNHSEDSDPSA